MIKGIVIPVITPFEHDGTADEPMLRKLVDFYVEAGVQGLFMLGSSGQGPAMSMAERKRTAEIAVDQNAGRAPLIVHVGTADAESTVELARHAAEHGVDGIGVIPPYYYLRPFGVRAHGPFQSGGGRRAAAHLHLREPQVLGHLPSRRPLRSA